MTLTRLTLPVATLLLASQPLEAQTASALLREGDVLTGAPAGHLVTSINSSSTNDNGGFVVGVNSTDGSSSLSHGWGSSNGASPGVLITESTVGPLVQTSFESWMGISNGGSIGYSAGGTGGPVGGFDSVWVDATPIAVEGDPHPTLAGQFWRFGSRPGITATGTPYFAGGISSTSGGNTENRGLFYGLSGAPLLLGGDVVPNLPEPISPAVGVSFDYRFSSLGNRYLAEVVMEGPSVTTSTDAAMVLTGSGLMLGGSLVREGTLVPVVVGGDGVENWANFDYTGVNEAGDYFFSGDTGGNTATDEFILHNGLIRFREGDTVDSQTLRGAIEGAYMNESGEIAYIWDIDDGLGGDIEALFFENDFLLAEGDEVDWDGDGNVDAGFVVTNFTGIAAMSLGSDSTIYFTADVDTNGGGVLEGFFGLSVSNAFTPYCFGDGTGNVCPCGNVSGAGEGCANSTNFGALLGASGTPNVLADTVVLHATQAPASIPGIFFQGNNSLGNGAPFGDGFLCAGGNIKRLQLVFTDGSGNADSSVTLSIAGSVIAGDLRHYQYWFRDVTGPCSSGFNTTNGLSIQW